MNENNKLKKQSDEVMIHLKEDFTEEELIELEYLSKKEKLPMRELLLKFIKSMLYADRNR